MRTHHERNITLLLFGALTLLVLSLWFASVSNRGLLQEIDPTGVQRLSTYDATGTA